MGSPPPPAEKTEVVSFEILNDKIDIPVVDGILHFPDLDTYLATEEAVTSTEHRRVSEEQLDQIEKKSSFVSLRRSLNELLVPYHDGSINYEALRVIVTENSEWLYLDNELPFFKLADRTQRALLNERGTVVIGNDKIVYRPDREIHYLSSIQVDYLNLPIETDEEAGVIVINYNSLQLGSGRSICSRPSGQPNAIQRFAESVEISDHKVTTLGGVRVGVKLLFDQVTGQPTNYQYWYRAHCEQRSWARASIGNNWRQGTRAKTDMTFTFGWGIQSQIANATGGTGWSSNNVRTITSTTNPYNTTYFYMSFYQSGALDAIYDYDAEYITSGVRSDEFSGMFVFACCPYTCSSLGYNDF
ncbi:hypothetical protein CEQ90_07850 [Lewinellaceae bacterium SD302]|nr:hypothetical protein CEQ90_07850 [Lewinellaceae bacterium SD302]